MDYLSTAVYYIACPIFYIFSFIFFVLAKITAPLLHLGRYCLYACCYALHVLDKFEASLVNLSMVETFY